MLLHLLNGKRLGFVSQSRGAWRYDKTLSRWARVIVQILKQRLRGLINNNRADFGECFVLFSGLQAPGF